MFYKNNKKIKIILYLPLALLFIANIFYFPVMAQAACIWEYLNWGAFNTRKSCQGSDPKYTIDQADSYCSASSKPDNNYGCCCEPDAAATPTKAETPKINYTMPKLQIPIPNLAPFTAPTCTETNGQKVCSSNWIGEYIAGIYKYAIGIVGILAAVVLMIGGVMWIMAGGSATMIGEAKSWIGASLTGLVIALCSYAILYQVNPALVTFNPLAIGIVKEIELVEADYTDPGGAASLIKGNVSYYYSTAGDINKVTSNNQKFLSNLESLNVQMRITSLISGRSTTEGPHSEGRGVDIGCWATEKNQCINLTKTIADQLGGDVTQIIHCVPGAVNKRNGKIYTNYQDAGWPADLCSAHTNHIHISVNK